MVNKFKRGLIVEEASLIATNLEQFDSLLDAKRSLRIEEQLMEVAKAELTNPYNDEIDSSINWDDIKAHDEDYKNLTEAEKIYEALLDEVAIACEWHDHLSGEVELYLTDIIPLPKNNTDLEVFQICRMAPDDEYSFCPIPTQTTITKISLAKWFYNHIPDKANLFDPTESYKTIETGYSRDKNLTIDILNTKAKKTDLKFNYSKKITETIVWQNLYKLTENALELFPSWQQSQPKPHNIPKSHIDEWLIETLKVTKREAETIKKIINEIFNL